MEFFDNFNEAFFHVANEYDILSNNQLFSSPVFRYYNDNYKDYLEYHFKNNRVLLPILISDVRDATYRHDVIQPVTKLSFYNTRGEIISKRVRTLWNDNHHAKFRKTPTSSF